MRTAGTTSFDTAVIARLVRRHRRPLAAALAFLAVLALASGLRAPATTDATGPPALGGEQVAVPVELASAGVAGLLAPGEVVDLVAVGEQGPFVIASEATVLRGASSGGFTAGGGTVVLVALDRRAAMAVLAHDGGLSVLLRGGSGPVPSGP